MTQSQPYEPLEYLACRCGCGCENDGEWHYVEPIGCRCASLKCPCVEDALAAPVVALRTFTHADGRECDLIHLGKYAWRVAYDPVRITEIKPVCYRSHLAP